ncbi:MAG: DUF3999 domain-containing protein [Gammaproteobacteria bacterium]|nr:DUF3999 domain-containing protein [Gammaproteobacteria bacterium]
MNLLSTLSVWPAALVLLAALSITLQAADRLQDFPLQIPLSITGDGPWHRLQIPMSVQLAAHHSDLRDLRLFNAAGESLAYNLLTSQARRDHSQTTYKVRGFPLYAQDALGVPSTDIHVQRNLQGTLVEVITKGAESAKAPDAVRRGWLLDGSGIDAPLDRLIIDWADVEGFQRFSIEASDDLQHWRSWGEGQVTRLSFDGEQVEQREVRLPDQKAHYLRLLWQSPAQAPELHSVQLLSSATTARPAPLTWSQAIPARQTGEHEYVWELPLSMPVERLRIPLEQTNILLPVSLQARAERTMKWRHLKRGLLFRVIQQDKELQQNELDLPGWSQVKELKLTIDPRGGGVLGQSPKLLFAIRSTEVVFLARGDQPYLLAIGKAGSQAATLPLSTLMPGAQNKDLDKLPRAVLLENPGEPSPAAPVLPGVRGADWKLIGLWTVLVGGVAILVLMAWSLLRSNKPRDG